MNEPTKRTNATRARAEREVPPGHVRVEVVAGVEGPCLSVGPSNRGGTRVAGPKPWGGGTVTCIFDVRARDLLRAMGLPVEVIDPPSELVFPLALDQCRDIPFSDGVVHDAAGRVLMEGPEATWRDLEAIVALANVGALLHAAAR